jgi:hypothetical protein
MNEAPPPPLFSPFAASHWLPVTVVLLIVALLALVLLDRLDRAAAESEKLMLELTVRNMNLGLQAAKGHALAQGREAEIRTWRGENPVRWLGGALPAYQGECRAAGRELAPGQWCFAAESGALVYAVKARGRVHDRQGRPLERLHWQVMPPPGSAADEALALRVWPQEDAVWTLQ